MLTIPQYPVVCQNNELHALLVQFLSGTTQYTDLTEAGRVV